MRQNNNIMKLLILTLLLVIIICIIPKTFSRYQTNTSADANLQAAFYVLKTSYEYQTIKLPQLEPRDEPYEYTFSIANNKDGKRLETRLVYNLSIRTTTNLPITYKLYKGTSTDAEISNEVIKDEDGTYFRKISANREYFSYLYDEVNTYKLVINFPSEYNNFEYQDIAEFIEIIIDSKQIIDGE